MGGGSWARGWILKIQSHSHHKVLERVNSKKRWWGRCIQWSQRNSLSVLVLLQTFVAELDSVPDGWTMNTCGLLNISVPNNSITFVQLYHYQHSGTAVTLDVKKKKNRPQLCFWHWYISQLIPVVLLRAEQVISTHIHISGAHKNFIEIYKKNFLTMNYSRNNMHLCF